jgi:hypothetical protein
VNEELLGEDVREGCVVDRKRPDRWLELILLSHWSLVDHDSLWSSW